MFTNEFYETCKEEITPVLYNLFLKIEEKGVFLNSVYEAKIMLIPKLYFKKLSKERKKERRERESRERKERKEPQTSIYFEYRWKKPQWNISKITLTCVKRIIHHDQVEFILGMQDLLNIKKSINVNHHINRLKKKNHRINRYRKSTGQNPTSIHDKNSQ